MFQVNPRQRIHMKNRALFSSNDKSKKLKCRLLHFLFGTLRVKINGHIFTLGEETLPFQFCLSSQ